ncbi:MAG: TIM barrel protein [Candidatus Latescibacteria bacterium]|nr:TIM barrel protein [Candidatus Latescibacterota bacterium]
MKISAFPKCYMDALSQDRSLSLFEWIDMARSLGAEGLELYDGFLLSLENDYLDQVGEALKKAGFAMPMMCCSPDFTNPDPEGRRRAIEREIRMIEVTRHLGGPNAVCRVLSGQRYPQLDQQQGLEWVVQAIEEILPVARQHKIVLGLENHFKDGYWQYPEFAQKQDVFLALLDAIPERRWFGVQYDPSNALVAGDDPLDLLRRVADRVVSMHASDRYLIPGATLEDLRQHDGTLGYAPDLKHGVTGEGLNDYDAIFSILAEVGYSGWVSIEDGMDGMDEMRRSIDFLKEKRDRYFPSG